MPSSASVPSFLTFPRFALGWFSPCAAGMDVHVAAARDALTAIESLAASTAASVASAHSAAVSALNAELSDAIASAATASEAALSAQNAAAAARADAESARAEAARADAVRRELVAAAEAAREAVESEAWAITAALIEKKQVEAELSAAAAVLDTSRKALQQCADSAGERLLLRTDAKFYKRLAAFLNDGHSLVALMCASRSTYGRTIVYMSKDAAPRPREIGNSSTCVDSLQALTPCTVACHTPTAVISR